MVFLKLSTNLIHCPFQNSVLGEPYTDLRPPCVGRRARATPAPGRRAAPVETRGMPTRRRGDFGTSMRPRIERSVGEGLPPGPRDARATRGAAAGRQGRGRANACATSRAAGTGTRGTTDSNSVGRRRIRAPRRRRRGRGDALGRRPSPAERATPSSDAWGPAGRTASSVRASEHSHRRARGVRRYRPGSKEAVALSVPAWPEATREAGGARGPGRRAGARRGARPTAPPRSGRARGRQRVATGGEEAAPTKRRGVAGPAGGRSKPSRSEGDGPATLWEGKRRSRRTAGDGCALGRGLSLLGWR